MENSSDLSQYAKSLPNLDLERYKQKLRVNIGGQDVVLKDPYTLNSGWLAQVAKLPPTDYGTIYSYLVLTPGPYTGEAMRAYKSLEAYNYFQSGHVREVSVHSISGDLPYCFVRAAVQPGQRSDGPFRPWVCLEKKCGYVVCTHCTCMGGLGEACSHIAALLFAIEAATYLDLNNEPASTSVKCIWNKYYKKEVRYYLICIFILCN